VRNSCHICAVLRISEVWTLLNEVQELTGLEQVLDRLCSGGGEGRRLAELAAARFLPGLAHLMRKVTLAQIAS
jgi:hypothetical protein